MNRKPTSCRQHGMRNRVEIPLQVARYSLTPFAISKSQIQKVLFPNNKERPCQWIKLHGYEAPNM